MFSAACNPPLPEPPKIRNRAPQFLFFGCFSNMAKLNLSPYEAFTKPSKAVIKALLSPY